MLCHWWGNELYRSTVYWSMALVDGNNLDWIICTILFIRRKTVFTRIEWSKLIINGSRTQCDHVLTVNSNGRKKATLYRTPQTIYFILPVQCHHLCSSAICYTFFSCVFLAICMVHEFWTVERGSLDPCEGKKLEQINHVFLVRNGSLLFYFLSTSCRAYLETPLL